MKSLRRFAQIYRRVKQHGTRYSIVITVLLFALFLEAYMHDFNLVYITLFFLFSLTFSAAPIGILNIGQLEAKPLRAARLFVGEEGQIPIEIKNFSKTAAWSVVLHNKSSSLPLKALKGESSKTLLLPFTPKKRGYQEYKGYYLESRYPLSTVRFVLPIKEPFRGIAYPEPRGDPLHSFLAQEEHYYGEEKEFDGLHTYDGSQKLSRIHWASVAKGEMSVKTFTKEHETSTLAFHFKSAGESDESRISQLCLWVLECEKQGLPFTIEMPHRVLESSKESIDEILTYLANY